MIIESAIEKVKEYTLITGGHYMINSNGEPILNNGTIDSFEKAVNLYHLNRENKTIKLGILVNDIGATCSGSGINSSCSLSLKYALKDFKLPAEYLAILDKYDISANEVVIYREKYIRNRSKKMFLKIIANNPSIKREHEGIWYVNEYDRIILTRINSFDKYGTPACPLIMAGLIFQQENDNYQHSINFYYVDKENLQNIPNLHVIEKGRYIAEKLNSKLKTKNYYLLKDQNRIIKSID